MAEQEPATPAPGAPTVPGKRRGKPKKKHTVMTVLLSTLVVLALVTGLGVVFAYRHLQGNITSTNPFQEVDDRPEDYDTGPKKALNILVMGLDTREGEGNDVDDETGAEGSDTTILLHVSADRSRAYGVSIPRDSLVERPDCGPDNEIPGASRQMWNKAFSLGGDACTIEQFEQTTGVRIDDSIVVDFNGFKGMVNAVGGVPMCIPYDIYDRKTKTTIKKGERELMGDEALAYVRLRYIGSGSDLDRIVRQQNFAASLVNKVVSKGTLARFDRVFRFLNAATKSLTVSKGLDDPKKLAGLGMSLNEVGLDQVQFLTVPNQPAAENPNRVEWSPEAETLWKKIAKDKPLSKEFTGKAVRADKGQGTKGKKDKDDSEAGSEAGSGDSADGSTDGSVDEVDSDEPTQEEIEAANRMGLCA